MYQPLAPDPLPAGPRVTNPLAPLLRLLLRAFSLALAAVSLCLIGAALWMGSQFRDGGGGGDDPPSPEPEPSPAPEPLLPLLGAAAVAAAAAVARGGALLAEQAVASFPW